jgi:hypothetical protein
MPKERGGDDDVRDDASPPCFEQRRPRARLMMMEADFQLDEIVAKA